MNVNVSKNPTGATVPPAAVTKPVLPDPYVIKDRCGRDHVVRFTKKRAEVLKLLQEGKSRQEILEKGYTPSIIGVVGWQAKKLGLLKPVDKSVPTKSDEQSKPGASAKEKPAK